MNKDRIYFNHSPKPTIGVEAELYTVSKDDYNLYSGAPVILKHFADDFHVKEELLECIVEVNTGICDNVPYNRKIMEYQKNNDYKDIIRLYIHELKKDMEPIC